MPGMQCMDCRAWAPEQGALRAAGLHTQAIQAESGQGRRSSTPAISAAGAGGHACRQGGSMHSCRLPFRHVLSMQAQAAEALSLPAAYDIRYRISAAVLSDAKRGRRAARQIDAVNAKLDGAEPRPSGTEACSLWPAPQSACLYMHLLIHRGAL